jgi:hypothetical protein
MNSPDLSGAAWRKSIRSASNEACVGVAPLTGAVGVRDQKDPTGPALVFGADAWSRFAGAARSGRYDLA